MKAVLFDLDGTLLPMDMDTFTNGYFKLLSNAVSFCGYEPETLVKSVWKATHAMVKNDGTKTNEDRFWEAFAEIYGNKVYQDIPFFDEFYTSGFMFVKSYTEPDPQKARAAIKAAKQAGDQVILATNPIFPMIAVTTRLQWIGLSLFDFDYVTSYENSHYCKPNPKYYEEILKANRLDPSDCLMIGNDVDEDAIAAAEAGLSCYLIKDCLINKNEQELPCPSGSFEEMLAYLDSLKK